MEPYFSYELTSKPTALFKSHFLRKGGKSVLSQELRKKINIEDPVVIKVVCRKFVADGGRLLHKVKWQQDVTFTTILQQYLNYVNKHFGYRVNIVFDAYGNGPSIKDHEHDRRSLKAAPDIFCDVNNHCISNQSSFLANESNKKTFVNALIETFHTSEHLVSQARDDADTLIVRRAVDITVSEPATVTANDTDVLILLLYHFQNMFADVFLSSDEPKKNSARQVLSWQLLGSR